MERFHRPPRLLSFLFLCAAVCAGCLACGGGGGGGADARAVQASLSGLGLETVSLKGDRIAEPLIYVGGSRGASENPRFLSSLLACRDDAPDAVFVLPTSVNGASRSAADVAAQLQSAIASLAAGRVDSVVIVGHNLGGLYARTALLAGSPAEAALIRVKLLTFYTPFAGTPNDPASLAQSPGSPSDFVSGSALIAAPGSLANNVEHYKFEIGGSAAALALARAGTDPIYPELQAQAAVDGDARLRARVVQDLLSWPFSVVNRVGEAFTIAGVGSGDRGLCAEGASVAKAPSATARAKLKDGESPTAGGTSYDEAEFARHGLQSPTLRGTFDPAKPTVIIVHGIDPDPDDFDGLVADLSQDNNVFLFIYDESGNAIGGFEDIAEDFHDQTDDLVDISESLAESTEFLVSFTGQSEITFVAHSMGGVITRYAVTNGGLADAPFFIHLVTVASPFGGFGFANANPLFWFSEISPVPGLFYGRMASGGSYIGDPGPLPPNASMIKVETIETGQTFNGRVDDAITLDQERNEIVDSDPRLVSTVTVEYGHVEAINDGGAIQIIHRSVDFLRSREAPPATDDPSPAPSASPQPSSSAAPSPTPVSTSTPGATSNPSPTSTPVEFGCRTGSYRPSGTAGCGLDGFALSPASGSVVLNPFGTNGAVTFIVNAQSTSASTGGLVIFGQPDHDCSISCAGAGNLSVFCSNPRGGRCSQQFGG